MRKTPILRPILNSLFAWGQKQKDREKDREIERMIANSGGRITDELERRIIQRDNASDWNIRW